MIREEENKAGRGRSVLLTRVVREGLTEEVTFDPRPKGEKRKGQDMALRLPFPEPAPAPRPGVDLPRVPWEPIQKFSAGTQNIQGWQAKSSEALESPWDTGGLGSEERPRPLPFPCFSHPQPLPLPLLLPPDGKGRWQGALPGNGQLLLFSEGHQDHWG